MDDDIEQAATALEAVLLRGEDVDLAALHAFYRLQPATSAEAEWQDRVGWQARNRVRLVEGAVPVPAHRPRVVIHIGMTKTGSTYLQHFCERNRAALFRRGIWFPEFGLMWQKARPHKQGGHGSFTHSGLQAQPGLMATFMAGLTPDVQTAVLSSEGFCLRADSTRLAALLDGAEVKVLVYLRRQDSWLASHYREGVIGGAYGRIACSPEAWLETAEGRRLLDYEGLLEEWAAVVGQENVILRPYEKSSLLGGDIVADVFDTLGLGTVDDLPPPDAAHRNDALAPAAYVPFFRQINAMPFASPADYLRFMARCEAEVFPHAPRIDAPVLSPSLHDRLLAEAAPMNARIARAWLGRSDGVLFRDDSPVAAADDQLPMIDPALAAEILKLYAAECGYPDPGVLRATLDAVEGSRLVRLARRLSITVRAFRLQLERFSF
jgi:hypothetical protein